MNKIIKYFDGENYHQYEAQILSNQIHYFDNDNNRNIIVINKDNLEIVKQGYINYHFIFEPGKTITFDYELNIGNQSATSTTEIIGLELNLQPRKINITYKQDGSELENSWEII